MFSKRNTRVSEYVAVQASKDCKGILFLLLDILFILINVGP